VLVWIPLVLALLAAAWNAVDAIAIAAKSTDLDPTGVAIARAAISGKTLYFAASVTVAGLFAGILLLSQRLGQVMETLDEPVS
jgi:hypothetical protein